ncbi:MAG: DegT/DnrJ/EryC1/StrS family aminotransferase [Nitrospinota bacterium]|nr:DegT/DnrJ/EryC1/StrS family aminotransferase [Nitrospinota bacterium]
MIRLSKSIVGQIEAEAVAKVICEDGYLGMGSEVKLFEEEIATFIGVPAENICCVNSGTAALHLAVQAVTEPGDEVLVQSLTFVASFQAISGAGAVPIPCEVLPESITLDIEDARKRLTEKTKAVMPVHYGSNPGNLDAIYEFAEKENLRVIEDAAHAFGCKYKGRNIGSFGDIICFSFDGIKNITSGEGGAIVTSDRNVMALAKDARLLGVEKDTEMRFNGKRSWEFDVKHQGYRFHMSNIFAAVGRVQLGRFISEFAPKRVAIAEKYRELLDGVKGLKLLESDLRFVVPHIMPVRILDGNRDGLKDYLEKKGIQTGIHYKPNHMLSLYGDRAYDLGTSEKLYSELLSLPLHPEVTEEHVVNICESIKSYF